MYCNYSSGSTTDVPNEACVYNQLYNYSQTDTLAKQLIAKICALVYIKPHFSVEPCNGIKTCRAFIYDDHHRYIFFDRDFIQQIVGTAGNDWSLIGILAHELGHHLDGHTLRPTNIEQHRKDELEADEFSGAILARMGASEVQALTPLFAPTVVHPSCEAENDDPYPCLESRKAAILRGYHLVKGSDIKKGFILNHDLDKIDISSFSASPVRDQGGDATCVGFDLAYCLEFEIQKRTGHTVLISPRYIYNRSGGKENTGLYMKSALDTIMKVGAIEEKYWPYKPNDYDSVKLAQANGVTKRYYIKSYKPIPVQTTDFRQALENKHAIFAGIKIYSGFMTQSVWLLSDSSSNETFSGYKSICIVGYDPKAGLFKFKNTWGLTWGQNGYGYFSEKDLAKLVNEAYYIELSTIQ